MTMTDSPVTTSMTSTTVRKDSPVTTIRMRVATDRRGRPWPGPRRGEDRGGVLPAEDLFLLARKTARPSDTGPGAPRGPPQPPPPPPPSPAGCTPARWPAGPNRSLPSSLTSHQAGNHRDPPRVPPTPGPQEEPRPALHRDTDSPALQPDRAPGHGPI